MPTFENSNGWFAPCRNTEHTQPILFMTVPAQPNDGIHAKDIEVCPWLLFNVFRVNACP
ncbi:MAG: hypothetical protein K2J29_03230 [Muribaculaceae bacterium]|nr:hypothetical protein [Muribaculaceae bacterium]MDE7189337.1 hypothetical protein [Muribaculaceae bacterium]